jgi:hypothetical protein
MYVGILLATLNSYLPQSVHAFELGLSFMICSVYFTVLSAIRPAVSDFLWYTYGVVTEDFKPKDKQ